MLKRPKQVALFAMAALGGSAVRSRERLMAMFWPETTASKASHSLSQTLYQIRQDLGDVIERQGDNLVVDPELVWCDVVAFQEAVAADLHGEAAALYRGDLLEGLYLSDAPDFERWVDEERAALRRTASGSLWTFAEELAGDGSLTEASNIARRAAALTPGEEATIHRLLGFLDGIGDRAGALAAYDEFTRYLEREYEVEPSPETVELVEAIRDRDEAVVSVPVRRPVVGGGGGSDRAPTGVPTSQRPGRRRLAAVLGVGAVAAVSAVVALWPEGPPPDGPMRLAVVVEPSVGGSREGPALGPREPQAAEQVARAVTAELAAVNGISVVPPAMLSGGLTGAERDGLSAVVAIDAWRAETGVRTEVQLIDPVARVLVSTRTFPEGERDAAVSRFVRQGLGDWQRRRRTELGAPSEEAIALLREADWLRIEGDRHMSEFRPTIATSFYLEADSVLAESEEAARTWVEPPLSRGSVARALASAAGLADPTDSATAAALLDDAEAHANRALALDPQSPFALELRGLARVTRLIVFGEESDSLISAAEDDLSLAVARLPSLSASWTRLAWLRAHRTDYGGALVAIRRALQIDFHLAHDRETRHALLRYAGWAGDRRVAERACAEGQRDFPDDPIFLECRIFLMSWLPELADLDAAREDLTKLEAGGAHYASTRQVRLAYYAGALAQAGLLDSARAVVDAVEQAPAGPDLAARELESVRVLTLLGDSTAALDRLRSLLATVSGLRRRLPADPRLRGLAGMPAFEALMDSLGLRSPSP